MKHTKPVQTKSAPARPLMERVLAEAYYPCGDKVLIVKEFLDDKYQPGLMDDVDEAGDPVKKPVAVRKERGRAGSKAVTLGELLLELDDRFAAMVSDKGDRRRLMKRIIIDWMNGDITDGGLLSVNFV